MNLNKNHTVGWKAYRRLEARVTCIIQQPRPSNTLNQ